ncbi:MAG: FGGY family carbohydrate kinase [Candidatus Freyarchaeota archaeon]
MAIDVGTGSVRCAVFDTSGNLVSFAIEPWDYESPPETFGLGKEFDCGELWKRITRLVREAMKRGKISGENILGVSSTSQREGIVLLDGEGKELYGGPNIDVRGILVDSKVREVLTPEVQRITGHWPPSMFAPARLIWFREWSEEIIERLQIPREILPEVHPAGTVVGEVTREASSATGLREGTPVITGGADTQCALLATGALDEGHICTIGGTTTPVQMVLSKPVIDAERRIWTGCHVVPDRWVIEGNCGIMGKVLEWFKNSIADAEAEEAVEKGVDPYDVLSGWAAGAPPGAGGIRAFMGPQIMDFSKELSVPPSVIVFPSLMLNPEALSKRNMIRSIPVSR